MKVFSNSDKIKSLIAPKMTYLITFFDKNVKSAVYSGGGIYVLYRYL